MTNVSNFLLKLRQVGGMVFLMLGASLVEATNFQTIFYSFMEVYRPGWGAFNHVPATMLAVIFLTAIIVYGIRRERLLSWGLAVLASVVSFTVYASMQLSWRFEEVGAVNLVVIILALFLPLLVAHTTHEIAKHLDGHKQEPKTYNVNEADYLKVLLSRQNGQYQNGHYEKKP